MKPQFKQTNPLLFDKVLQVLSADRLCQSKLRMIYNMTGGVNKTSLCVLTLVTFECGAALNDAESLFMA